MSRLIALVAGSTGATGKYIAHELLENEEVERATAITRKTKTKPERIFQIR